MNKTYQLLVVFIFGLMMTLPGHSKTRQAFELGKGSQDEINRGLRLDIFPDCFLGDCNRVHGRSLGQEGGGYIPDLDPNKNGSDPYDKDKSDSLNLKSSKDETPLAKSDFIQILEHLDEGQDKILPGSDCPDFYECAGQEGGYEGGGIILEEFDRAIMKAAFRAKLTALGGASFGVLASGTVNCTARLNNYEFNKSSRALLMEDGKTVAMLSNATNLRDQNGDLIYTFELRDECEFVVDNVVPELESALRKGVSI